MARAAAATAEGAGPPSDVVSDENGTEGGVTLSTCSPVPASPSGFGGCGLGFGVWGLGFGGWGLGFRVSGLGCRFRIWDLGFRM